MNLPIACTSRKTWSAPNVQIVPAANAQSAITPPGNDGNLTAPFLFS